MKFLVLIAALIALPAMAQTKPATHPEAANTVSALALGWFVLPAAILTGKREGLCKLMGGKFDLSAPDQCAGGQWLNVALFLKSNQEQPK